MAEYSDYSGKNDLTSIMRRVADSKVRQHTARISISQTVTIPNTYSSSDNDGERVDHYNTYDDTAATLTTTDVSSEGTEEYTDSSSDTLSSFDGSSTETYDMYTGTEETTDNERNTPNETGDALGNAKSKLKKVEMELDKETEMKSQMEGVLQHERETAMSPQNVKILNSMDEKIRILREEKDAMGKTLQSGIKEAARIAREIKSVREDLTEVKLEEEEATNMNNNITFAKEKLSKEVDSKVELRTRLEDMKDDLQGQVTHTTERLNQLNQDTLDAQSKFEELSNFRTELTNNTRRIEVIQVAMSCLSATLRRAEHVTGKIHTAVEAGTTEGIHPGQDDGYDSEEDAPHTDSPMAQYLISEPVIKEVHKRVAAISDYLGLYSINEASREEKAAQDHIARVAKMKVIMVEVLRDLENKINEERTMVNDALHEREKFLAYLKEQEIKAKNFKISDTPELSKRSSKRVSISPFRNDDASLSDTNFSLTLDPTVVEDIAANVDLKTEAEPDDQIQKSQTVLERIAETNKVFLKEKTVLFDNNTKWKTKLDAQKEDFLSVKKLKRSYRDLESENVMIGISIHEMEDRNRELKLDILNYTDNYVALPRM